MRYTDSCPLCEPVCDLGQVSWPHVVCAQEYGLTNGDCQKLQEAGFHTLESVAFTPKKCELLYIPLLGVELTDARQC